MLSQLDEKKILITLVGILTALSENCLLIDEAEKFYFSPNMYKRLKKQDCNEQILDIIARGCELEDIKSLLPDNLQNDINKLLHESLDLLKGYQKFVKENWIETTVG